MKYRNHKTGDFDSKKEARRAQELSLLLRTGAIRDLEIHPKFELLPKLKGWRAIAYVADFAYTDCGTGERVVEDVKSEFTRKLPVYRLKKRLMKHFHNIEVQEV